MFTESVPDICIIAPPGAGKGTQADELVRTTGRIHVEMSAVIQAMADPALKSSMAKGNLASDERAFHSLSRYLKTQSPTARLVVDGLPRTEVQARAMLPYFFRRTGIFPLVIILQVEDSICLKRLAHRTLMAKMAREMRNAGDGEVISERVDDVPEVHAFRLKKHNESLPGIIDYLRQHAFDRLIMVDGSGSIEEVSDKIHREVSMRIPILA